MGRMGMTARERLFAALRGEPTDRLPIWLLFPYHPLGCYGDVRNTACYLPIVEAAERCAITLDRRSLGVPLFTDAVKQWREDVADGDARVIREVLEYKGKRLVAETRYEPRRTMVKKMLSDDESLDIYCSLPMNFERRAVEQALDQRIPQYVTEREEFPRDFGSMMLALGEPIGRIQQSANLEAFAIWSLTRSDQVEDFLRRVQRQYREVYRYCIERDLADVFFMVGSELAAPPVVSRDTFQRWIVPFAQELIEMVHRRGKSVIQHFHGQIREILPDFLTMGADALHTIEAPPVGNCTMTQAYDVVGDALTLIGNIQYDCFRAHTPAEMRETVHALIDECRGKRFILSPTAGPYEAEIPQRMVDNYLAFIEAGWECGWESARPGADGDAL